MQGARDYRIQTIHAEEDLSYLSVDLMRPTVVNSVWDMATQEGLRIEYPVFSQGSLRLFVERKDEQTWNRLLQRLQVDGFVRQYRLERGQIPIRLEGERLSGYAAALGDVIEKLAQNSILVTMGSASMHEIVVAVPYTHTVEAQEALQALRRHEKGDEVS